MSYYMHIQSNLSIKTIHGRMEKWSLFTGCLYSETHYIKSCQCDKNMVSRQILENIVGITNPKIHVACLYFIQLV